MRHTYNHCCYYHYYILYYILLLLYYYYHLLLLISLIVIIIIIIYYYCYLLLLLLSSSLLIYSMCSISIYSIFTQLQSAAAVIFFSSRTGSLQSLLKPVHFPMASKRLRPPTQRLRRRRRCSVVVFNF